MPVTKKEETYTLTQLIEDVANGIAPEFVHDVCFGSVSQSKYTANKGLVKLEVGDDIFDEIEYNSISQRNSIIERFRRTKMNAKRRAVIIVPYMNLEEKNKKWD